MLSTIAHQTSDNRAALGDFVGKVGGDQAPLRSMVALDEESAICFYKQGHS